MIDTALTYALIAVVSFYAGALRFWTRRKTGRGIPEYIPPPPPPAPVRHSYKAHWLVPQVIYRDKLSQCPVRVHKAAARPEVGRKYTARGVLWHERTGSFHIIDIEDDQLESMEVEYPQAMDRPELPDSEPERP